MVIKRDGSKVEFDITKIENAIKRAFIECEYPDNKYLKKRVTKLANLVSMDAIFRQEEVFTEDIQYTIEITLMYNKFYTVARNIIRYNSKNNN